MFTTPPEASSPRPRLLLLPTLLQSGQPTYFYLALIIDVDWQEVSDLFTELIALLGKGRGRWGLFLGEVEEEIVGET
jgi:DNA repair photolyase